MVLLITCGAGEGWRKSVGTTLQEKRKQSQEVKEYPIYNKTRNATWIGHILRRNCLLKQVSERKITEVIEVTEKRGTKR